jgi:hypothetical protein
MRSRVGVSHHTPKLFTEVLSNLLFGTPKLNSGSAGHFFNNKELPISDWGALEVFFDEGET